MTVRPAVREIVAAELELLLRHLPGLHDQATHGRRKPFPQLSHAEAVAMQDAIEARRPIKPEQKAALSRYRGSDYRYFNGLLRDDPKQMGLMKLSGEADSVKRDVAHATEALAPLPQNVRVFRGTTYDSFGIKGVFGSGTARRELKKLEGKTLQDPGFLSTSITPDGSFTGPVQVRIDVPAGTRGAYQATPSLGGSLLEKELLLAPGQKLRITQVDSDATPIVVNARIVTPRAKRTAVAEVVRSELLRHLPGLHDQSSHGNWAKKLGTKPKAKKAPKKKKTVPGGFISSAEALAMQDKMLADEPWNFEQVKALNEYSSMNYQYINGLLRGTPGYATPDDIPAHVRDQVLASVTHVSDAMRPLAEPVVVTRNTRFSSFGLGTLDLDGMLALEGKTFQDAGLMSTTIDPQELDGAFAYDAYMTIDVPAGTPAAYVESISKFPREHELILGPGTTLLLEKVVTAGPHEKAIHIKARVVPVATSRSRTIRMLVRGELHRLIRHPGHPDQKVHGNWAKKKLAEAFTGPVAASKAAQAKNTTKKATPKPKTKAATAAIRSGDFSGLKKLSDRKGFNEGGLYEAADGSRWYVKAQDNLDRANNEVLANALYRELGVTMPEVVVGQGAPALNGPQTASRWVDTEDPDTLPTERGEAFIKAIQKDFAVDAWLANWDVVGAGERHNIESLAGKPIRIEAGGALKYRGTGGLKGAAFGDKANEWQSMRDPKVNPSTAAVFGPMTPDELAASAERLKQISPKKIRDLVSAHGLEPDLADKLIARRKDILKRGVATKAPKTSPKPTAHAGAPTITPKAAQAMQDEMLAREPWSVDQRESLRIWTTEAYNDINKLLYQPGIMFLPTHVPSKEVGERLIEQMHNGMRPLPKPVRVFREVNHHQLGLDPTESVSDVVGKTVQNPGFSATSVDKDHTFSDFGQAMMVIDVPAGYPAAYLESISENSGEFELLLDAGAKYEISRVDLSESKPLVYAKVVPR